MIRLRKTRRFAIVFVGRQGSSYLQGLINNHPDATCRGELLANASVPSDGLEEHLNTMLAETAGTRAVGFKLPWVSIERWPHIWDLLDRHRYRLILLTRANQFISMWLAQRSGIWSSDGGKIVDQRVGPFEADYVARAMQTHEFQDAMLRQAAKSFPSIELTYEQLTAPDGYYPALSFLGLARVPLRSKFEKQRRGRQSEILVNYREIKEQLSPTRWAHHFVD